MNYSTHRISLDIHDTASQISISVKRNDSNRKIIATLMENGKPYTITEECRAEFNAITVGDIGTVPTQVECTIDGNTIQYIISPSVTEGSGTKECEFKLYGADDALLTSPRFTIIVEDAIYNGEGVTEGEGEVSVLTSLISDATTLITDVTTKLENGDFQGEQGIQGEPGLNGRDGVDGKNGANGINGVSPTIDVVTENGVKTLVITDVKGTKKVAIDDLISEEIGVSTVEFVSLFDVFYGDKTDMRSKSLVAVENQSSGAAFLAHITKDDVTDDYNISFGDDYVTIGDVMGLNPVDVKCGIGEVFNLYEHFGLSGNDTIIIEDAELSILERGLFDGVANLSTIASLFANKSSSGSSSESTAKYAEVKYVEADDDIVKICGQDGYPDVTIVVEVTMSCGCSFTDTLRYYTEDYSTYTITSTYFDPSNYTSVDLHSGSNFDLLKHYEGGHADATWGGCNGETPTKILVKSVSYGDVADGETKVITNGEVSMALLVNLGVL